jgi:hypothetical protein
MSEFHAGFDCSFNSWSEIWDGSCVCLGILVSTKQQTGFFQHGWLYWGALNSDLSATAFGLCLPPLNYKIRSIAIPSKVSIFLLGSSLLLCSIKLTFILLLLFYNPSFITSRICRTLYTVSMAGCVQKEHRISCMERVCDYFTRWTFAGYFLKGYL